MIVQSGSRHNPAYRWFAKARFGMFIHFSFASLPLQWEEAGKINIPAGRVELVMQPTWIEWGFYFADVAALELVPVRHKCGKTAWFTERNKA